MEDKSSKPAAKPNLTRRRETDHFIMYYTDQDEEVLDALAEAFEGCYKRVTSDLGKTLPGRTRVDISPDLEAHHNAVGRPDDPDWSVGEARNGCIYIVSPLNPGPVHHYHSIIAVAVHEFVHIVVEQFKRCQPFYLNEGIACYEAGQLDNIKYYVPKDRENGTLPSLTDLEDDNIIGDGRVYTYGPAYVDFVVKTFGFDKILAQLEGKPQTEVFGMSMEELNEKWMGWLQAKTA